MREDQYGTKITRRDFIKGITAGTGVTALLESGAGVSEAFTAAKVPQWNHEADVVILGFGLAGAVSAIEAYDQDPKAKIVILEKMSSELSGGNSRVSGQTIWCPEPADFDNVVAYRNALDEPNPLPDDLLQTWAHAQVEQTAWIQARAEEVGFQLDKIPFTVVEFPELPGAESVKALYTISEQVTEAWDAGAGVRSMKYPSGSYNAFKANIEKRTIPVLYETPARELILDPATKGVVGVVAQEKGREVFIKARRAVVVCVGGFENNQQMLKDFYGSETVYTLGTPGNTGDGITMLLKVGADLWHMRSRAQTGGFWLGMKFPGYETPFFRNIAMTSGSWIEIGKDGNRFYNEGYPWWKKHMHQKRHGNYVDLPHVDTLPVHMIFDETTRKDDCLATTWMSWSVIVKGYQWSGDNSEEIKKGWIIKADTIGELAGKIGRTPEQLEETVKRYNGYAQAGNDPEFGRSPETMQPIIRPPFYAVNLYPCLVLTTGGGRRNEQAQVLDPDGKPIPRLYEAGELGSTMATLYQNGESLSECIVFGRIAGKRAVQEKPWMG